MNCRGNYLLHIGIRLSVVSITIFWTRTTAIVTLAVLFLFAPQAQPQGQEPEYRLGPGDRLQVTVFGQNDLSGEFEVNGAGQISMPLIQWVLVAGLTVQETELVIAGKLSPDYLKNPRVSVSVLNYRPFYIIGEVNRPGSYPYVSGMTVLNSIALAGGFTYRAKKSKVKIIRADDPEKRKQKAAADTEVLPGDIIEVPERFF